MRTIGRRKERPVSFSPSAELLVEGARFNEEIHRLPTGKETRIPKGIYRFKTHAESNRQELDCVIQSVAHTALKRS